MQLLKTSIRNKNCNGGFTPFETARTRRARFRTGFTMLEVLMAIAIMTVLFGLGVFLSIDVYRGYISRSDQMTLVSMLSRARSLSLTNYSGAAWGVCYDSAAKNYVLFRAPFVTGAATNEPTPANPGVSISSTPAGFLCNSVGLVGEVFTQLSGTTSALVITETQNARVSTTTINYEGTINW